MKKLILSALLCAIPAWAQDAPPAVPQVAPQNAPFDWQIRLKNGQKFRTTMQITLKMAQGVPGATPKTTSKIETQSQTRFVFDQNVLSSDPSGAQIEIVYREMKQNIRVMQNSKLQFDSATAPQGNAAMSDIAKRIVGARIRYTLSARGKVSDVQGFEEYFNRIWATTGKGKSAAEQATFRRTFEKMMSPQALKSLFEQSRGALPVGPVALGESWTYQVTAPAAVAVMPSIRGKRTFAARRDGLVVIDETATFGTNGNNPITLPKTANSQGAAPTMRVAISGAQSGQTLVDEATGMARESRFTQRMKGQFTINNADGKGTTITVPLDSLTQTTSKTQLLPPDAP